MNDNILMVGGSNVPAVCRAAARRGLNIIAVNFPESFEKMERHPSIIHTEGVDFRQLMPTVRQLLDLHARFGFVGVVSVSEYGLLPAAMVARQLGMPGTALPVVQNTRDKARMRRALEAKGLGQVRFRACNTVDEAREFLVSVGGPIILKPVMGTGSDGVSRVDDAGQLADAWQLAGSARASGGVLCEELVDGPEVSVEAYVAGGTFVPVAITDKLTDERFLEIGHSQPTRLTPAMKHRVFAATHQVLSALGVTDAVTHTEMRLSARGPVLIETHTRMGGDFIDVLTNETTGVDLGEIHVALALGEQPRTQPFALSKGAAIRFATGPAGRVAAIDLPPLGDGVHEVRNYVRVGDRTSGRSASLDRFGHVIAVGPNRAEADRIADEAIARCRYDVRPKERLLFIGGSDSREVLDAAARRGVELVVLRLASTLHKLAVGGPVIAIETLDLDQPLSAMVSSIVEVAQRHGVQGIVPVMEFGLMPATIAAAKLGFPAHSIKAVRVTRDKTLMRRTLDAAGLRQIAHAACRTPDEVRAFLASTGTSIIVKPVSGAGSDGVTRVDDPSQVDAAWNLAVGSVAFTGVICEQYIEGPEVSVEGYCAGGAFIPVAITDKTTNENFLEVGHDQPSLYPAEVQQRIFDYTARVLAALGVTDGWTHTEVRLGSSDPRRMDPVIVETHTRRGGASIDVITRHASGVSTAEVMFDFALGIAPTARPRHTGEAAVVRFVIGPPGVVESVDVPALPERGVSHVQIDVRPGDTVSGRSSSSSRIGHVVGTGRDIPEAIRNAEAFCARIHIRYATAEEQRWTTPAA